MKSDLPKSDISEGREQIVRELLQTKKYRDACVDTLEHVAAWALDRYKTPKDALKAAKRKMHQIYGAYFDNAGLKPVRNLIEQIPANASNDSLMEICTAILGCHASTRERLPILDQFYRRLFEAIGPFRSILDIGCGLNPFTWPWLAAAARVGTRGAADDAGREIQYCACDIDGRLIEATNAFFRRIGRPETAYLHDILSNPSCPLIAEAPDTVLLFKLLPCLEQQQKGSSVSLLRRLPGRHVVVSFPARSLGGKNKGMAEHYGAFIEQIICALNASAQKIESDVEIFYILSRK